MGIIEHVCITPDLKKGGICTAILSDAELGSVVCVIKDASGNVVSETKSNDKNFFAEVKNAHLWTIENPYLYTAEMEITLANGEKERFSDHFGMRSLGVANDDILLNGKPFYMRAYIRGTVCHEHENILDLPEEEFYAKAIKIAKEYGFNTIRFHSRVPSKACFDAADKLGMFIHIEMRHSDEEYNNMDEMVHGIQEFITDERVREVVYTNMNHPSLAVYCIGNEIKHPGANARVRELSEYIKKLDPSRLFIDTCAHGEFDRKYVEFDVQHMSYYFPFGSHYDMFENTDNLLVFGSCTGLDVTSESEKNDAKGYVTRSIVPSRPIIAHEVCHYTALRDLETLSEKYKKAGKPAPWWVEEEHKMIDAKGMRENYEKMFGASKAFQLMGWKLALEGIRRSPILRGFHMLQFADTDRYENSNGVVDCFDEKSGVDEKKFLKFNGDTVLLADLPVRSFFEGETAVVPVSVSNYTQVEYGTCNLKYSLIDTETGDEIISGGLDKIDIDGKEHFELVKIHLTFPKCGKSRSMRLEVSLNAENGAIIENEWDMWCFKNSPEKIDFTDCSINLTKTNAVSRYPQTASLPKFGGKTYITDVLDDEVFKALDEGRNVLLLYREEITRHVRSRSAKAGKYSFRATWDRFKTVVWDRGTNYGGIVNNGEALKAFPNKGISDIQFARLIDDCDKIILDDFPVKVSPIFEGIDKSTRDRFDVYPAGFGLSELQYDRTMRKFSYISELSVGKGKLLVTGLNFTGLGTEIPEVCGMFETLVDYVQSDRFVPTASISVKELSEHLAHNSTLGPVRERMMTQFWQLDDTPVESARYWIDSKEYAAEGDREAEARNK